MAGDDNMKKEEEAPEKVPEEVPDEDHKEEPKADPKSKEDSKSKEDAVDVEEQDGGAETTKDADEEKEDEKDEGKDREAKDNTDTAERVIKKRGPRNRLDPVPEKSGKRQRKSAEAYKPPDFTEVRPYKEVPKGRGTKLRDIPALKEIIDAITVQDPKKEIFNAFRFLFAVRGKVTPQDKKDRLLDFAGFLPPIDEEEDKDAREKKDEDAEAKMAQKAFKLTVPEIKALCDFFCVDRMPADKEKNIDKDTLIDRLLDFLGAPDEKMLAKKPSASTPTPAAKTGTPKKKKGPVPKNKKVPPEDDADEDEDTLKGATGKGKIPSDDELRAWVKAYVACFDLDKATTKHALQTASDKFGVDLSSKKTRIKELLGEEM